MVVRSIFLLDAMGDIITGTSDASLSRANRRQVSAPLVYSFPNSDPHTELMTMRFQSQMRCWLKSLAHAWNHGQRRGQRPNSQRRSRSVRVRGRDGDDMINVECTFVPVSIHEGASNDTVMVAAHGDSWERRNEIRENEKTRCHNTAHEASNDIGPRRAVGPEPHEFRQADYQ